MYEPNIEITIEEEKEKIFPSEGGKWWIQIDKAMTAHRFVYFVRLIQETEEEGQTVYDEKVFKELSKAMVFAEQLQEENFDAVRCGILLYGFSRTLSDWGIPEERWGQFEGN